MEQKNHGSGREASEGGEEAREHTSPLEWAVAAVSAVVVFGAIGFLAYEALNASASPPVIEIAVEQVVESGTGYTVVFWAHNHGHSTAAGVTVEGELRQGGASVEKSSVTIDYVPSESRRKAGLFFSKDPRQYTLDLRPTGYDVP